MTELLTTGAVVLTENNAGGHVQTFIGSLPWADGTDGTYAVINSSSGQGRDLADTHLSKMFGQGAPTSFTLTIRVSATGSDEPATGIPGGVAIAVDLSMRSGGDGYIGSWYADDNYGDVRIPNDGVIRDLTFEWTPFGSTAPWWPTGMGWPDLVRSFSGTWVQVYPMYATDVSVTVYELSVTATLAEALVPAFTAVVDASGRVVNFDASASTSSSAIVSYAWDFGDAAYGVLPGQSSAGVQVSHTYIALRSYDVTLTVTDDAGLTASVTHTVLLEPGAIDGDYVNDRCAFSGAM